MEKEHQPDSMATINMKPEYPPSEVYSTASEPPPAYRQRMSSSVQIARIIALTVVASSFIVGSFILASSWVTARSSCHQLEQLDAMLEKELALEGRAYGNDGLLPDEPLPVANAHALHGVPPPAAPTSTWTAAPSQQPAGANQAKEDALNQAESKLDEDRLQKIDGDSKTENANSEADDSSESDSSAEDEDELDAIRPMFKLPIQFDLDELAGAFLANNNNKGRMNCMVERRQEEPMERRFPFNILGAFAPRSSHAERIAIICHGGEEQRSMNFPEPQSQVFAFPLSGPVRLPIRPQPDSSAPGPMAMSEPRMPPFAPLGPQHRQGPFPLPMPWDSSEEQMNAPREMRIHVQRVIAIPSPHNMPPPPEGMSPFAPPPPPPQHQHEQSEQNAVVHQFVPQVAPTQELEQQEGQKMQMEHMPMQMSNQMGGLPWGLTPEDLQVIQRTAEDAAASQQRREQQQHQMDNDMQEVKTIVNTLVEAEAEAAAAAEEQRRQDSRQPAMESMHNQRAPRTLMLPQEMSMDERPHYVQPRSVRSVDDALAPKRVKRCSCACK